MEPLRDRCGRPISSLRVSVTDRCNLRCSYCMPREGMEFSPRDELLSFEEIALVVEVAASLGVGRIRLTGGEPLLRRGLESLVRALKATAGVQDVALTTNALLLAKHARTLREAGLDRLNISIDSLRPDRFEQMTRLGLLDEVWRGVTAAADAGFTRTKVNAVILRGFNDDEVAEWLRLADERDLVVRFLELMPIGEGFRLMTHGSFANLTQIREELVRAHGLVPATAEIGNGPARYWRRPGGRGMVGFITPISDPYCDTCSRFRLTSTGELRPCLAHDVHVPLREAARAGDRDALREAFRHAAAIKSEGHRWQLGQATRTGMSELGG